MLRRIPAKIVSKRSHGPIGEFLRPVQVRYGTRGGAEAAVHAVRNFVHCKLDSPKLLPKVDFQNAFNSLHRQKILEVCKKKTFVNMAHFFVSFIEKTLVCNLATIR